MSEVVNIRYVLKHKESGFYVTDKEGKNFTKQRGYAREWRENYKPDEDYWRKLMESGEYTVIQITETTVTEYREVDI